MAEVFVIGEIVGASGFSNSELCCKFSIEADSNWELREGIVRGQTQDGGMTVWSHPIDVHYACHSPVGWPKLVFQVLKLDQYGRYDLEGYGFCHIPSTPGMHFIDCATWRPTGNLQEQISEFFIGGVPQLKNESIIHLSDNRNRLRTQSAGVVHLSLSVIQRDFQKFGIQMRTDTTLSSRGD